MVFLFYVSAVHGIFGSWSLVDGHRQYSDTDDNNKALRESLENDRAPAIYF